MKYELELIKLNYWCKLKTKENVAKTPTVFLDFEKKNVFYDCCLKMIPKLVGLLFKFILNTFEVVEK